MEDNKGWGEYRKYVVDKLGTLEEDFEAIRATQVEILVQLSSLKVKASFWGLLGGLIPIVVALSYMAIRSKL